MLDGQDGLRGYSEGAFEEEIVNADNGSGERVFDGGQKSIREAFVNGPKGGVKRGTRNRGDAFTEKLDCGFFAESARLALKCNAHFMDNSTPQHGHDVRRFP